MADASLFQPFGGLELAGFLSDVLDTAIAIHTAQFGTLQVFDRESSSLRIAAQRGFGAKFLDYFREVRCDDGCACGRASNGSRVVVFDVTTDPEFEPHREIALEAGFRAVQSTPIQRRDDGALLGVLSTHFREPKAPSVNALIQTDVCANVAARAIDRLLLTQCSQTSSETQPQPQLDASGILHGAFADLLRADRFSRWTGAVGFPSDLSLLIQRATFVYATSRQADGTSPEAMLVELKSLLRQFDDHVPSELRSQLLTDIVRWSIDAYYGERPIGG